jgi:predicted GH43/DUF377 family glycosyl hydrolase
MNITKFLQTELDTDAYLFNPSIANVINNIYLISVRAFKHIPNLPVFHDIPPTNNPQHPWKSGWGGNTKLDSTFIILAKLNQNNNLESLNKNNIKLDVQDLRIFKLYSDSKTASYILTFNNAFQDEKLTIKNADRCDDYCYNISWGYLAIDLNTYKINYKLSNKPLCKNISNQIEKNWSLWSLNNKNNIIPMISYSLVPDHSAYSFQFDKKFNIIDCYMETQRNLKNNLLSNLEKYFENNLYVSLSTPSYKFNETEFLSVGHIKIKKNINKPNLRKFLQKYPGKYLHSTFYYFMVLYTFTMETASSIIAPQAVENKEISAGFIEKKSKRINVPIKRISNAFMVNTDYLLNFPCGLVVRDNDIIISYGNGDSSSYLLFLDNTRVNKLLKNVENMTPESYKFIKLK